MKTKKLRREQNSYQILKEAKADYQSLKANKGRFITQQTEIVREILASKTPNWGGISITLTNI